MMFNVLILHIAEVLLALIFILGGASAVRQPEGRAVAVSSFHIPLATMAVRLNGLVMIIAGIWLATGFHVSIAAWILLLTLLPTTIIGHPFWREQGLQRQMQLTHFLKNLGLLGGLLLVAISSV